MTSSNFYKTLGGRIRLLRKKKGLSQTNLSQYLGVSFQQLQKYEKGTNRVPIDTLMKCAEVLEVQLQDLLWEPSREVPEFQPSKEGIELAALIHELRQLDSSDKKLFLDVIKTFNKVKKENEALPTSQAIEVLSEQYHEGLAALASALKESQSLR